MPCAQNARSYTLRSELPQVVVASLSSTDMLIELQCSYVVLTQELWPQVVVASLSSTDMLIELLCSYIVLTQELWPQLHPSKLRRADSTK